MLNVLATTTPVFLIILLGYAAARFGLFARAELRAMGRLVINFALPALMFLSLSRQPLAAIARPDYLAAYALASLTVYGLALTAMKVRGRSLARASVLGIGAANSNSAFIGLPVALQAFGPLASVGVALAMIVENLVILLLGLAVAESSAKQKAAEDGQGTARHTLLAGIARNPLILAILAGTIAAVFQLQLPGPLFRAADLLAKASTPVALFVVGGTLADLRTHGLKADVAILTFGKLFIHPLLVAAAVLFFLPGDPLAHVAILVAAAPMFSIFPIIAQRFGEEEASAAAVVVATILSFFSLTVTLWLLSSL